MDPPLRETMLVRGDVDAITGFTFTSLLNLEARGVKAEDVVMLPYPNYGVKLYGNVVIVSPKLIKENPEAVKAFLRAFTKGVKDVIADPAARHRDVKARDGIINDRRSRRAACKLAHRHRHQQPDARAEGFGQVNARPPVADGLAGVRRVRHQDARQPRRGVERLLPAAEGRTQHPAAAKK